MSTTGFDIECTTIGDDVRRLAVKGYLDAHTAPDLEKVIGEELSNGNIKMIVNFSNLEYISSAGLGVFMVYIEDIRSKAGDLKLTSLSEKVFTVFDLLGFPMLFDILNTDEEALEKFNQ
jgi:anti-sigma B factor antagonist